MLYVKQLDSKDISIELHEMENNFLKIKMLNDTLKT